jgi:predicted metalloprotease with PDZ domain
LLSAEQSSLTAPFIDRAQHIQRTNLANTSISYYPKGELLGLVLDLLIRGKTNGKASLDDVMRRMYEEFYLKSPNATYYLRGRGYTPEDLQRVATEVAGFDFSDFFSRHVRGVEPPPYDEALSYVGFRLVREQAHEPYSAGMTINSVNNESPTIGSVLNRSAAEDAGLQSGDKILTLGGKKVTNTDWSRTLNRYQQGDRVPISVRRDRRTIQATIVLGPPERFEYRVEERRDATAEQKGLRAAWLRGF